MIDDYLMQKAMKETGLTTKRATVEAVVKMLLKVKAQTRIRRLRGKVCWSGDLNQLRTSRAREL